LRLRLNHALELWREGYAAPDHDTRRPGGDPRYTEGHRRPRLPGPAGSSLEQIIVEEQSESTVQTIIAASEIMRRMGLKSAILVSDGYHIFAPSASWSRPA